MYLHHVMLMRSLRDSFQVLDSLAGSFTPECTQTFTVWHFNTTNPTSSYSKIHVRLHLITDSEFSTYKFKKKLMVKASSEHQTQPNKLGHLRHAHYLGKGAGQIRTQDQWPAS